MATHDTGPSGTEDSPPGAQQAAKPELNVYGVPVPQPRPTGRACQLELVCFLCGIVSAALGITDEIVRGQLPVYLVALGILSGFVAMVVVVVTAAKRDDVTWWLAIAASMLGFIGVILVVSAAWPHACASGCGY